MLRPCIKSKFSGSFPRPWKKSWARYTDHRAWARYMGLGRVALVPEGHATPNGVGCVRSITVGGVEMVAEEVLEFEAPARMKYRIVRRGGPIREHEGEVLFAPEADGTRVTWRCHFNTLPGMGWMLRLGIRGFFVYLLRGIESTLKRS